MKTVNILSIVQAHQNLNEDLFEKLMKSYGVDSGIKPQEMDSIAFLVKALLDIKYDISIVDKYYLGYKIPRIGNEFDLLRFGKNYIINIELKSESTIEKIKKQQKRNKTLLSFLNIEFHIYTYVMKTNTVYKLTDCGESEEVTIKELYNRLLYQQVITYNNIDDLFKPSDYLISPFNNTHAFFEEKYFLTQLQQEIFNKIKDKLSDTTINFIALTGGAGTGKTLLTYHIAKEQMKNGKKVLILHCGKLNAGHTTLRDDFHWSVYSAKNMPSASDYDLLIVDEAQRLWIDQFEKCKKEVLQHNKKCIFSYDKNQYLSFNEKNNNIAEKIENELNCTPHILAGKIRISDEIADFIEQLFQYSNNKNRSNYPNIELTYCKDNDTAISLLQQMSNEGWKIPYYTPAIYPKSFPYEDYELIYEESAHSVIGQEFDKIVVVIDEFFRYDDQNKLTAYKCYYLQSQMLYQIITRARNKLHIVIINNKELLERCVNILHRQSCNESHNNDNGQKHKIIIADYTNLPNNII